MNVKTKWKTVDHSGSSFDSIGRRCHELRIQDENKAWRIIYRVDADAVVILEVFNKTTPQTPQRVIEDRKNRVRKYDLL